MTKERNPWDIPEWHSIGRESALVRQLIGSGVTALGRANYADQMGQYYSAFFNLSIGFERLAKLILVADYVISNNGQMPNQTIVRKFGHNILDLLVAVDQISQKHGIKPRYCRPSNKISWKILEILDGFADAKKGRYANFADLGDPSLVSEDPIRKWWDAVAELILKQHYYGKSIQHQVETKARQIDSIMSPHALVLYSNESGNVMKDIFSASVRTGQTQLTQRFGRYYTLLLARWLSDVFSEITRTACYTHNSDAFFGAWEHMQTFTVDDCFLKTRKVWPLS